jgi:hypothetical protein
MIGRKGQGSLEYLIIIAAVLAIAAVVVLYLSGVLTGSPASFAECRLKASECEGMQIAGPFNCYDMCAAACIDRGGGDLITGEAEATACVSTATTACGYCMDGLIEDIQPV